MKDLGQPHRFWDVLGSVLNTSLQGSLPDAIEARLHRELYLAIQPSSNQTLLRRGLYLANQTLEGQ